MKWDGVYQGLSMLMDTLQSTQWTVAMPTGAPMYRHLSFAWWVTALCFLAIDWEAEVQAVPGRWRSGPPLWWSWHSWGSSVYSAGTPKGNRVRQLLQAVRMILFRLTQGERLQHQSELNSKNMLSTGCAEGEVLKQEKGEGKELAVIVMTSPVLIHLEEKWTSHRFHNLLI